MERRTGLNEKENLHTPGNAEKRGGNSGEKAIKESPPADGFSWEIERGFLKLYGSLNRTTVPQVEEGIAEANLIGVDLSGLTGLDPAGIAFLELLIKKRASGGESNLELPAGDDKTADDNGSTAPPTLPEALRPLWETCTPIIICRLVISRRQLKV